MLSVFDQENLANSHQTTAAGKPLNQTIRNLQSRTPGANLKTPFRARKDENRTVNTGKTAQNAFVTPGPAARAPLGAKTTNAKARAFQTPAPFDKTNVNLQTSKRSSATRRLIKKNIQPLQQDSVKEELQPSVEDGSEPEFGYTPPPIIPLPDPPLEFDYDTTYACLRPENFTRGVGEIYFQSPKDESGFSISAKREEEAFKKSLEDDLDKITDNPIVILSDCEEGLGDLLKRGPKVATANSAPHGKTIIKETKINTVQSRAAASKLSGLASAPRPKLPAVVDRETTSSRQKRKPLFAVSKDSSEPPHATRLPPASKNTIGFPKAKKPVSIIPKDSSVATQHHAATNGNNGTTEEAHTPDQSRISPRKFLALYGEPPVESDMWFRLKELQIRDRRREEDTEEPSQPKGDELFASDVDMDADVDAKLAVMFEMEDADDFEL